VTFDPPLAGPDPLDPGTAELDVIEAGHPPSRRRAVHVPPQVRLGHLAEGGLAPAVAAVVERGVRRRPSIAAGMRIEVELGIEGYPPVRVVFGDRLVLVEDGHGVAPDLRVEGELGDLVGMMVTPLVGGFPHPMKPEGRAAIGKVAFGHLRVEGRISLMRRLLGLLRF